MEVQVEVQFTVQHTLEELKAEFVQRGHIPEWKVLEMARPPLFFETKVVTRYLVSEEDRLAWFVFSLEACGELRQRIVIPNVVQSGVTVEHHELRDFLKFCRDCLVNTPENH